MQWTKRNKYLEIHATQQGIRLVIEIGTVQFEMVDAHSLYLSHKCGQDIVNEHPLYLDAHLQYLSHTKNVAKILRKSIYNLQRTATYFGACWKVS